MLTEQTLCAGCQAQRLKIAESALQGIESSTTFLGWANKSEPDYSQPRAQHDLIWADLRAQSISVATACQA